MLISLFPDATFMHRFMVVVDVGCCLVVVLSAYMCACIQWLFCELAFASLANSWIIRPMWLLRMLPFCTIYWCLRYLHQDKLACFRIKELKDVLTQLGLAKQGKKQVSYCYCLIRLLIGFKIYLELEVVNVMQEMPWDMG